MNVNQPTIVEMLLADWRGNLTKRPEQRASMFMMSEPGTGKTQILGLAAELANDDADFMAENKRRYDADTFEMLPFRATLHEPVDLTGIPAVITDEMLKQQVLVWIKDQHWPRDGAGVIFLDEFPQGTPQMMAALGQIISELAIGDFKIGRGWNVVLAGNRATDRSASFIVPQQIDNRVYTVTLVPALKPWVEWARANNIDDTVTRFLQFRPAAFTNFDPARPTNPSARVWELVSGVRQQNMHGTIGERAKVEGYVGAGIAAEYFAYVDAGDSLPAIEDVERSPQTARVPHEEDLNALHATAFAVGASVTPENSDSLVAYLARLPSEYATMGVAEAVRLFPEIKATKAYIDICLTHAKLVSGTPDENALGVKS